MDYLYSVIIPAYNVEKYLNQCVDSVLNQTYSNFEIILVDDGSTDNSRVICDEYKNKDSRIKVIHQTNVGLSAARNTGIEQAIGDYIIFMDSDDYWLNKNMLANINSSTKEYPNVFISWGYQYCEENETKSDNKEILEYKYCNLENSYKGLFRKNILFASACHSAIPTAWFTKNELDFEVGDLSEDVEWYAKVLSKLNNLIVFDEPLYIYRNREKSISRNGNKKTVNMMKKHIEYLINNYKDSDSVLQTYIGEQTANFVIIVSRCETPGEYFEYIDSNKHIMKYTVRNRSRLIYYCLQILGINKTIKLLNAIDR